VITALIAALGVALGLAAHDLAVQGLREDRLQPFAGTCPRCRNRRGWHRVRCPHCGRAVSREIWVAASVGAGAFGTHNGFGLDPHLWPYLGFLTLTAALTVTDLDEMRIVDRLNLPGTLILFAFLAGVAMATGSGVDLVRGLLGAAAYFGGTTLLFVIAGGKGFGAGDVKLSPVLGLFTAYISWGTLGWAVFITAMVGGVLGVLAIVFGKSGMKTELPYGPPMVVGAWAAILLALAGAFPT
jgi:leader peptidase (prepilin peptidase) / N-methyltransferase